MCCYLLWSGDKIYGLPKLPKVKDTHSTIPPYTPSVCSIDTSLQLSKVSLFFTQATHFLGVLWNRFLLIQDADFNDMFMVSYDVTSLFTNIPLSETIDLAANAKLRIVLGWTSN